MYFAVSIILCAFTRCVASTKQLKYRLVLRIQIVFVVATSWEKISFEAGDRFTLPCTKNMNTYTAFNGAAHIKILFFQREFHCEICDAVISHAEQTQPYNECLALHALNDNDYTMNDCQLCWKNVQFAIFGMYRKQIENVCM